MSISKHQTARRLLANQRQMTSLIDKEMISASDDLVFDRTDWVPLYYDKGYAVASNCGKMTAYRAATLDQRLLWLVFTEGKARGFHATATCPVEAIDQAQSAWARRRDVRRDWYLVEQTAKDLMTGRARFPVRIEDAHDSPLCTLGIEGFMRSIGLGRVKTVSGRVAALMMQIEPQVGFVIFEAMQREGYVPKPAKSQRSEAPARKLEAEAR